MHTYNTTCMHTRLSTYQNFHKQSLYSRERRKLPRIDYYPENKVNYKYLSSTNNRKRERENEKDNIIIEIRSNLEIEAREYESSLLKEVIHKGDCVWAVGEEFVHFVNKRRSCSYDSGSNDNQKEKKKEDWIMKVQDFVVCSYFFSFLFLYEPYMNI